MWQVRGINGNWLRENLPNCNKLIFSSLTNQSFTHDLVNHNHQFELPMHGKMVRAFAIASFIIKLVRILKKVSIFGLGKTSANRFKLAKVILLPPL